MLPDTHTQLTPLDLYPDRMKLCFQFECHATSAAFATARRQLSHPLIRSLPKRWYMVDIGNGIAPFHCQLNRAREGAPITLYVDVNPLRYLHHRAINYGGERAHDPDRDNWLHPSDVSRSNQIVRRATEEICEHAGHAALLLASAVSDGFGGDSRPLDRSVVELEVAVDLASARPALLVERLSSNVVQMLSECFDREHRMRQPAYLGLVQNAHTASGKLASGHFIKIYDKTNARVRIEVTLNSVAARRLGIRCRVENNNFLQIFDSAAAAVLDTIQTLATPSPVIVQSGYSPLEAAAIICVGMRDQANAVAAIEAAALTGRLCAPPFDRQLLIRLTRRGVLERTGRGVFSVTAAYRDAFRFLRFGNAASQGFRPGGGE